MQDPCIYDSTGTLLTLLHWRRPSRALWVPLLDTKLMPRLASGRRQESYFPIAVADNKFHCIILKGGDQYPYFPRPLLSEFDFSIPMTSAPASKAKSSSSSRPRTNGTANDDEDIDMNDDADADNNSDVNGDDENATASSETHTLEQQFLLRNIQAAQLQDLVDATTSSRGGPSKQRIALARLEVELDKTLLKLLAVECREGEDRGMRALEMVELLRDRTGRVIEAAGKIAERYGRGILGEKIREVGERRLASGEHEEDDDPFDG